MSDSPSTEVPSRRRGAVLEQAILCATVEELAESGYAGLTMERVAKRAGTNKNALYRRWPNRAALGVAAYRRLVDDTLRPPDTGELRGDVLALLRNINCEQSAPRGDLLRGLLAEASGDPELLAQLREHAVNGATTLWLTVLGRAVARGEALPEALHPRVATVALDLLRNESITRGVGTVPDHVLVDIVDEVYLPLIRRRGQTPD
jgi:AcrR family transcriptional regulator